MTDIGSHFNLIKMNEAKMKKYDRRESSGMDDAMNKSDLLFCIEQTRLNSERKYGLNLLNEHFNKKETLQYRGGGGGAFGKGLNTNKAIIHKSAYNI